MPAVQNKKLVNRELQRLGLGHLNDPNLIAQMAYLVRDHDHFRGILMHMPPGDRHEAYKCLAPKLRFKALSLEDYEIQSKQLAEKNQLPEYNAATLEAKEWGSRNVSTERKKTCALCLAGDPITTGAPVQYHNYKPQDSGATKIACCDSDFIPSGCIISGRIAGCTDYLASDDEITASQMESAEHAEELAETAQRAIAKDLREEGAKYQLRLVCRQCTFEQTFRVKRKSSAYKLARTDGWQIDSATALCRLCKATIN